MKYRKKPVVIEAMQVGSSDDSHSEILAWAWPNRSVPQPLIRVHPSGFRIDTLEGTMYANVGDWIIRGVKGELYPCKPDIFAATYEPVGVAKEEHPQ